MNAIYKYVEEKDHFPNNSTQLSLLPYIKYSMYHVMCIQFPTHTHFNETLIDLINFLDIFFTNFERFGAYPAASQLKFLEHTSFFPFWWISKKLWPWKEELPFFLTHVLWLVNHYSCSYSPINELIVEEPSASWFGPKYVVTLTKVQCKGIHIFYFLLLWTLFSN